jgi:hypothetical protein
MPATYEPIATSTLGSAANSITFSSIPGTYTDLRIVFNVSGLSTGNDPAIRVNGNTAGYSGTWLRGSGSAGSSSRFTATSSIFLSPWSGGLTSNPSLFTIDIFSYTTSVNKTFLVSSSMDNNGSGSIGYVVGLRTTTNAITSVTLILSPSGNFNSGTIATLYGIKAA